LGRLSGAAGAIPSELVAGLAEEGRGKGARMARGRFGSALGVGRPGRLGRRRGPAAAAATTAPARAPVLLGSPGFGRMR
jgi:hypothetical protein